MKIHVKKTGKHRWCADRPALAGSPVVGYGRTWKEALGDMVVNDPKAFGIDHDAAHGVGVICFKEDGTPYKHPEPDR